VGVLDDNSDIMVRRQSSSANLAGRYQCHLRPQGPRTSRGVGGQPDISASPKLAHHMHRATVMASNRTKPANKQAQRRRPNSASRLAHVHCVCQGQKWLPTRTKKTHQGMPNRPLEYDKRGNHTQASQSEVRIVAHSGG
jgi:hypothetical protein